MPEIRPFRALRYQPDVVGDPGAVVAPPYDVIDAERQRVLLARHPKNAVRLDLPPAEPGDGARRSLPARGADAGRVALRRDAAQGPAPVGLRVRADVPRPGHGRGARPARVLRRSCGSSRWAPGVPPARADDDGPEGGPLPAAARDRHQHEPDRRAVRGPVRARPRRRSRRPPRGAGRRRHRRRRRPASAVGGHRIRRRRRAGARSSATEPGAAPVVIADGHHRYETALRYRDERRMTPLVRGGPGVRLRAGPVPRRAARRSRCCPPIGWSAAGRRRPARWSTGCAAAVRGDARPPPRSSWRGSAAPAARRRRAVRRLDAARRRVALARRGRVRVARWASVGTRRPAAGRGAPRRDAGASRSGSTPRRWRAAAGRYTKSAADAIARRRRAARRRRCRVPPRAHARRVDPGGRARGRGHAPEVDLLLSRRPSPASSSTRTSGEPSEHR